ncbi:MAG: hypothetical protein AB8B63_08600 [Granulosicoccus sp.]
MNNQQTDPPVFLYDTGYTQTANVTTNTIARQIKRTITALALFSVLIVSALGWILSRHRHTTTELESSLEFIAHVDLELVSLVN